MRYVIAFLLAAAFAGSSVATATESVVENVSLPGGIAGIAGALGLEPSIDRARAMPELARLIHSVREGVNESVDARLQDLEAYLDTVSQFQSSLDSLDASTRGISLQSAADRNERRRLEAFLDLIGLRLRQKDRRFVVERRTDTRGAERAQLLQRIGVDLTDVVARLNQNETIRLEIPSDTVPIPLTRSVWETAILRRKTPNLVSAILGDRRAALLCHGLAAADDETLAFLGTNAELLHRLYEEHSAVFAAFGESLHIRNGRVVAPGGQDAAAIWEAVLDERVDQPERFIRELFSRSSGHAAYLYDLAANLDAPQRAFMLGTWMPDTRQRVARLRQLIDISVATSVRWEIGLRPFARPADDVATIVTSIRVQANGVPEQPNTRRFWDRAFDGVDLPDDAERDLRDDDPEIIDATWIVERTMVEDLYERRRRVSQFVFGQRLSDAVEHRSLPDVLVAVRAVPLYRTLMLTLERIGVRNPAIYSASAKTARLLSTLDIERRSIALKQFQGALSLVEKLHRAQSVSDIEGESVAGSLVTQPVVDGRYQGRIVSWIRQVLFPVLKIEPTATERELIEKMVGAGAGADQRQVNWEGASYRIDLPRQEIQRTMQIRQQQGQPTIDMAIRLEQIAMSLQSPKVTLDDARKLASELSVISKLLVPPKVTKDELPGGIDRLYDPRPDLAAVTRNLSRVRQTRDLERVSRNAPQVLDIADWAAGEALTSIAFALELRDPKTAVLSGQNVAIRHDFGFGNKNGGEVRLAVSWSDPFVDISPGRPWRTQGSILGLDGTLAHLAFQRTASDVKPSPLFSDNERNTFTRSLGFMSVYDFSDSGQAAIALGTERGRQRIAELTASPGNLESVADEIQMDGWRRRAVQWALTNDPPAVPSYFTMTDYLRLGNGDIASDWASWGMAESDCYCLRLPARFEAWAATGREQRGILAAQIADLNLHVAATLERLRLPSSLTKAVLTLALQEFLNQVRPTDANDWLTLVRAAQAVPQEKIEDYIATLTVNGPLYLSDSAAP